MYDFSSSDIHTHMTVITDQVSRLCLIIRHTRSHTSLLVGGSGERIAKITVNTVCKSGTVRAACQAGPAIYLGIADILAGILGNFFAQIAPGSVIYHRAIAGIRIVTVCCR